MNALERCFEANRLLRSITAKAHDVVDLYEFKDGDGARPILEYMRQEARQLRRVWPVNASERLDQLDYALNDATPDSMLRLVGDIAVRLAEDYDAYSHSLQMSQSTEMLEGLLHPVVLASSYAQFRDGYYRDAVLNSIVVVFDLIRSRTGVDKDGASLVNEVFSLERPLLVFSSLESESGQSDQKGFMEMLRGAYQGIRNPKAHSLWTDLDEHKTVQYLVFASLLARRVEEAIART